MYVSYVKIKHIEKILISRYSLENEVINWFCAVEVGVISTAHASKAESRAIPEFALPQIENLARP